MCTTNPPNLTQKKLSIQGKPQTIRLGVFDSLILTPSFKKPPTPKFNFFIFFSHGLLMSSTKAL